MHGWSACEIQVLNAQYLQLTGERILPRASDLWVQAPLDYKQRLQQLFFPEGIAFDRNRFNRTAATAPLFNYLAPSESADEKMVSQEGIEPSTRRFRENDWRSSNCLHPMLSLCNTRAFVSSGCRSGETP